jgi:hypothetical protein
VLSIEREWVDRRTETYADERFAVGAKVCHQVLAYPIVEMPDAAPAQPGDQYYVAVPAQLGFVCVSLGIRHRSMEWFEPHEFDVPEMSQDIEDVQEQFPDAVILPSVPQ